MEEVTGSQVTGSQQIMIFSIFAAIIISVVTSFVYWMNSSKTEEKQEEVKKDPAPKSEQKAAKKYAPAVKQNAAKKGTKRAAPTSHPLYINMLKGHTDTIHDMDLDQSGKLLATASADRTIRVWYIKDMEKGRDIKYTRIAVDTVPTSVSIAPDSKAVAVLLPDSGCVDIYRLGKKAGDDAVRVLSISNIKGELKDVAISPTGKFIIISTTATSVHIYTLKGELLHTIDTAQMSNGQVTITPCNDLVAAAGFTPEVHIWAVQFGKGATSSPFQQVREAMDLSGHKSGVYSFDFSGDTRRAATVSKDGTWRVFNIDVSWQLREDPRLICCGNVPEQAHAYIAMSQDGRVVAIATNTSINLYNADTAELIDSLECIHSDDIRGISFSDTGKYLYSRGGDKSVRIWLNRAGMIRDIERWTDSIKTATNASHKERLKQQIADARTTLQQLE